MTTLEEGSVSGAGTMLVGSTGKIVTAAATPRMARAVADRRELKYTIILNSALG